MISAIDSFLDLKVGDIIYPAYDAKPTRITKVIITNIFNDRSNITVKGEFFAKRDKELEVTFTRKVDLEFNQIFYYAYVLYDSDDSDHKTLMQNLDIEPESNDEIQNYPNGGDYYSLITESKYQQWIKKGYFPKEYLTNLTN